VQRATFGVSPSTPGRYDNRTYFGYRLAAPSHYGDYVSLNNYSAKPVALSVAAVDLSNAKDGSISAGLSQQDATDAGKWIKLDHSPEVIVPPQTSAGPGQVVIPFTVDVPAGTTPGDHAGAIIATLTTISHDKNQTNLKLNQRVGARVLIRVAGALKPNMEITGLSATYEQTINPFGKGKAKVHYTIKNTGNTILGAKQSVTISDKFGDHRVPASDTPEIPLLLPGKSATMQFTVSDVRPLIFEKLTVKVTPLVQSSDQSSVHIGAVTASTTFLAVPWALIGLILFVIAGGIALFLWRRHRIRNPKGGGKHSHRRGGGDDLAEEPEPTDVTV
jgi:hypothetical protein